jgi:hypothetical protein
MSFARFRALTVVGVLFVCALVLVVAALIRDTQSRAGATRECPPGHVPADLRLPDEKNIKINVYNATDRRGLAESIANEFESREFTIANKDKIKEANDPLKKRVEGAAELRYGPKAHGAAWVINAYFLGEADLQIDLKRSDDVVDVVLGEKFRQLATVTEVNQSLVSLGLPTPPPGTCAMR